MCQDASDAHLTSMLCACLQALIKAFRLACALAVQRVKDLSVKLDGDLEEKKSLLKKCASTTLNSKLVRQRWSGWQRGRLKCGVQSWGQTRPSLQVFWNRLGHNMVEKAWWPGARGVNAQSRPGPGFGKGGLKSHAQRRQVVKAHTSWEVSHPYMCGGCVMFFHAPMQVSGEKEFFAQMVVDAVSVLDIQTLDLKLIGIKKVCFFEETSD